MERDWVAFKSFLGEHSHICGIYTFNFSSSVCDCFCVLSGRAAAPAFVSGRAPTVEERTVLALQGEPVRISTLGLISI